MTFVEKFFSLQPTARTAGSIQTPSRRPENTPGRRQNTKTAKRVRAGYPARRNSPGAAAYFILAVLASSSAFLAASSAFLMRGPTCLTFMRSVRSFW